MRDLLGGDHIVDLDQYLIDDDTYGNLLQNNLRNPTGRSAKATGSATTTTCSARQSISAPRPNTKPNGSGSSLRPESAREASSAEAITRKNSSREIAPTASPARCVLPPIGCRVGSAIRSRPGTIWNSRPPFGPHAGAGRSLLNPEYNNRTTDHPVEEKRYEAELGYTWSGRDFRFQATLYAIRTSDGAEVRRYYDDASRVYSDMVASNIGTLRCGIEAAAFLRMTPRWNLHLAFSAGSYRYAENPRVTVYADTDNAVIDHNAESYMGDCRLGNTPQLTGLASVNYYGRRGWGFGSMPPTPANATSNPP